MRKGRKEEKEPDQWKCDGFSKRHAGRIHIYESHRLCMGL
jgi:hypothetical protein